MKTEIINATWSKRLIFKPVICRICRNIKQRSKVNCRRGIRRDVNNYILESVWI